MRRVTTRLRSRANYALSLHTVTVIDRPILSAPGGDPTDPWIAWWSSDHRPALRVWFGQPHYGLCSIASVQLARDALDVLLDSALRDHQLFLGESRARRARSPSGGNPLLR
jgi:hypothetical protein